MFTITAEQARKETVDPASLPGFPEDVARIEKEIKFQCAKGVRHAIIKLVHPIWMDGFIEILNRRGFSAKRVVCTEDSIYVSW